jgi:3-methyladenine DNA glycosylase AlkD
MAASKRLIGALRHDLRSRANRELASQMRSYVKSSMPLYGVGAESLREVCKKVFHQYPLGNFEDWRDTVQVLWRRAKFREERGCAIELCETRKYKAFQTLHALPLYEEMIVTGAWWDLVDPIASHRIRYLLSQFPRDMAPVLRAWSRGDDIWKRRAAIISQLRLQEKTDLGLLYQCIEPSIDSSEFFLQKAIGWALRDYAWHDIREIVRYVDANKSRLSKLSQREALKNRSKLEPIR